MVEINNGVGIVPRHHRIAALVPHSMLGVLPVGAALNNSVVRQVLSNNAIPMEPLGLPFCIIAAGILINRTNHKAIYGEVSIPDNRANAVQIINDSVNIGLLKSF